MVWIYILELKEGKYYIGKSDDPSNRILDHFKGNGSTWTKKYEPIRVKEKIADCTDYHEDMYTKMYMDKYGIDNVRGGSWVTLVLDESTIKHLKMSSTATNDRCLGCDGDDHFIKNCPNKNIVVPIIEFKNGCKRCGRNNHKKKFCYAKKDINKNIIKDSDCLRCGRRCITELCNKTHDILGKIIENKDITSNKSNEYIDNSDTIINMITRSNIDINLLNRVDHLNKFQDINPIELNLPIYEFNNISEQSNTLEQINNKTCIIISSILTIIFIIGCSLIGKQL